MRVLTIGWLCFIDYLVDRVSDAVEYGLGRPSGSAKHHSRRASIHIKERAKLVDFFSKVLRRAEVTMSVILGALIYIDRARPHLRIAIEGELPDSTKPHILLRLFVYFGTSHRIAS